MPLKYYNEFRYPYKPQEIKELNIIVIKRMNFGKITGFRSQLGHF